MRREPDARAELALPELPIVEFDRSRARIESVFFYRSLPLYVGSIERTFTTKGGPLPFRQFWPKSVRLRPPRFLFFMISNIGNNINRIKHFIEKETKIIRLDFELWELMLPILSRVYNFPQSWHCHRYGFTEYFTLYCHCLRESYWLRYWPCVKILKVIRWCCACRIFRKVAIAVGKRFTWLLYCNWPWSTWLVSFFFS